MRPNVWPWLVAGGVNLAVAGVLLGVPYARGPQRAALVPGRFATFAACFYDGEPLEEPGLGLPAGERSRYASLVLRAPSDWPARCEDSLEAIPAVESMFLFPSVKNAEAQVRAAVRLMGTELRTLSERRAEEDLRVPDRPQRAMARLRGALAELGLASGAHGLSAERDAISIHAPDDLPTPSIIPLRVSRGRAWSVAVEDGAVLARTMDSRAVVRVRVEEGRVDQRVTRRPRSVRAMVGAAGAPWVVWSTSSRTCAASPDGCERRATGLAALLEDRQTLEPMVWVGAHPIGSAAHSVHVVDRVAHVVTARGGAAEVMRFELPEPSVRALGEEREVPRCTATDHWDLRATAPSSFAWIEGTPTRLAYAGEGSAGVLSLEPNATPITFDAPPGRHPTVAACGDWIVAVTERSGTAWHASGGTFSLDQRIDPPDATSIRLVCRGARVEIWTLADRALTRAHCAAEGCSTREDLRRGVAAFDALSFRGDTFVAFTDHADEGVVRVTRLAASGARTQIPSACWSDPPGGLCGEPRLATDGTLLALVTRQEEDLRVITSRDGDRFDNLRGLEQR